VQSGKPMRQIISGAPADGSAEKRGTSELLQEASSDGCFVAFNEVAQERQRYWSSHSEGSNVA
jgi:hypothetical protein